MPWLWRCWRLFSSSYATGPRETAGGPGQTPPRRTALLNWLVLPVLGLAGPPVLAEAGGEQVMLFRDADIGNFVISLVIFALVIFALGRLGWRPC